MRVTLGSNVHHFVVSILLAVHRRPALRGGEQRLPCAGGVISMLVNDVNHALLSALLAIHRYRVALYF